jgi:hypothetical protein
MGVFNRSSACSTWPFRLFGQSDETRDRPIALNVQTVLGECWNSRLNAHGGGGTAAIDDLFVP